MHPTEHAPEATTAVQRPSEHDHCSIPTLLASIVFARELPISNRKITHPVKAPTPYGPMIFQASAAQTNQKSYTLFLFVSEQGDTFNNLIAPPLTPPQTQKIVSLWLGGLWPTTPPAPWRADGFSTAPAWAMQL